MTRFLVSGEYFEATVLDSKSIGQDVFRTVSVENHQLDCERVKMLNGQLDLSEIFSEAVTEEEGRLMKNLERIVRIAKLPSTKTDL